MRVTREFSDPAVALVLERRFPRELGDRLITAVELADPRVAEKYGYSKALIERTITDAADRVEKVPVTEVFDWRRLRIFGLWCGTVDGRHVLAWSAIGAAAYGMAVNGSFAPVDYFWYFNDTAAIWGERNLLLMNSYWPRQALSGSHSLSGHGPPPGEMRVGRDEQRPDVQIRAIQWVVADHHAADGWRALRWADLPDYVDKQLLDKVAIPEIVGQLARGPRRSGTGNSQRRLAAELGRAKPWLRHARSWTARSARESEKAGAEQAALDLLDWQRWTLDKIQLQEARGDIRRALARTYPEAYQALVAVFDQVAALARTARYSRTLRQLEIPRLIHVYYRGAKHQKRPRPRSPSGQ